MLILETSLFTRTWALAGLVELQREGALQKRCRQRGEFCEDVGCAGELSCWVASPRGVSGIRVLVTRRSRKLLILTLRRCRDMVLQESREWKESKCGRFFSSSWKVCLINTNVLIIAGDPVLWSF